MSDGRKFDDIRAFKQLLLKDERQIARNFVQQLLLYSTGEATRFSDRAAVEQILDRAAATDYGIRSLVLALVQSPLFQEK